MSKEPNLLADIDLETLTEIIFFIKKEILFKILLLTYSKKKIPYLKYIAEKISPNNFYIQYFSLKNIFYDIDEVNGDNKFNAASAAGVMHSVRTMNYLSQIMDAIEESIEENIEDESEQDESDVGESEEDELDQDESEVGESEEDESDVGESEEDELDESAIENMQHALNALINNFSVLFSSLSNKVKDISSQLEIMEKEIEEISAEDDEENGVLEEQHKLTAEKSYPSDDNGETHKEKESTNGEVEKNNFEIEEAELLSYQDEVEELQEAILNIRGMLNSGYLEYLNMFNPAVSVADSNNINNNANNNINNNANNNINNNANNNINNNAIYNNSDKDKPPNTEKIKSLDLQISQDEIDSFIDKIADRFVSLMKKLKKPLILLIDDFESSFPPAEHINNSENRAIQHNIVIELIKRIISALNTILNKNQKKDKDLGASNAIYHSISLLLSYRVESTKRVKNEQINNVLEEIIRGNSQFEIKKISYN